MAQTQKEMIEIHLKNYGSITPKEAWDRYSCMRLASVIFDLKEKGMNIVTKDKTEKNQFGEDATFAEYVLEEPKKDGELF